MSNICPKVAGQVDGHFVVRAPKRMTDFHCLARAQLVKAMGNIKQGGVPWPNHLSVMPCGNGSNRCCRLPNVEGGTTRVVSRLTDVRFSRELFLCSRRE